MSNWKSIAAAAALVVMILLTQTAAQPGDKKKDPADPATGKETGKDTGKDTEAAKKPATHKVEKKPFKIEVSIKGVLATDEPSEIAHRSSPVVGLPYTPGPLTIRKIVPHGAKVKQGDVLASFDTRRIDQAISQVESDIKVLDAGIKVAEKENPLLEKSLPVDLEGAERSKREADEDLAYFLKISKGELEKRAHLIVKYAAFSLDYAKEQLRQLEKMYKSQDLAEDTEKMILKRQQFMVEEATHEFKVAELERDYILKTSLPRRETNLRDGVVKQTLALEKARTTLTPNLSQKQEALAKMRVDRERLTAGLEMLQKDRAAMTLVSPVEGVVYYGKFTPDQWEIADALAKKLTVDGTVSPDEVFLTIVKAGPLFLRVDVEEKDVHLVKAGIEGKARMVFNPAVKLPARVTKISTMPTSPGKFEANVALETGDRKDLVPGMASNLKFVPYSKKEAIAVPSSAVYEEDDKHYVDVYQKDKTEKRQVTPGQEHDGHTEITEGLRAGEEILLDRTPEKKSPPAKGGSES